MPDGPLALPCRMRPGPALKPDSEFTFRCGSDLVCFTQCCRNVSIVLTPYDVVRMKRALRLDSSDFLRNYTIAANFPTSRAPILFLRMDEGTVKCPFVKDRGCSIYRDRPWACRMYPLALAKASQNGSGESDFYFIIQEDICLGHGSSGPMSVRAWRASQGVEEYEMMGASFQQLMLNDFWMKEEALSLEKISMYFMACYDLDRFRRFVFDTSFLKRFVIDEARIDAVREEDEELLELAMEWLRFSLFGEQTMKLRST